MVSRERYQLSTVIMVGVVALLIGLVAGVPFGRSTVGDGSSHDDRGRRQRHATARTPSACMTAEPEPWCFDNGLVGPPPAEGATVRVLFAFVPRSVDKTMQTARIVAWEPA